MNGADYVAAVNLYGRKGELLAKAGSRCAKVPEESLPWLERDGLIVTAAAAVDKPKARRKLEEE